MIDYDFSPAHALRRYEGGNMPAWGITMFSQIDGGTVTTTEARSHPSTAIASVNPSW